jgi:iron complex outermembrane receptor protein
MPVNAIARIEVIRGPGAAVFGADAFAGVINLITKTKQDIEGTETGVRAGSFDSYEGWLLHGEDYGGFDVALSLEYQTTDGHKEVVQEDAPTQFDKLFGTHASLAPGRSMPSMMLPNCAPMYPVATGAYGRAGSSSAIA